MSLRSQGYCGVGSRLLGLHWVWCNGRGLHLELRQELQGCSLFLTLNSGSVQSWDRRVMPRLGLRHGTPLASRVVHGVTGPLSSCIGTSEFFRMMHRGVSAPPCCDFIHRVAFEEVSGHQVLIKSRPGNRGLSVCGTTHEDMSRNTL